MRQQRAERRSDALTKARIVDAAVALLDEGGTDALTFRALAGVLATGAGALYHHVASKGELLAEAASSAMAEVLAESSGPDPARSVRAVLAAVFDAITARSWLGTQLVAAPWQPAVLQLFDRVGSDLTALGVPERSQFDAASALVHHVLGVAGQYDATRRLADVAPSRPAFLRSATSPLLGAGAERYPFLARVGQDLVDHDDREQFRAGIEIILTGIETLRTADRESQRDAG